MNLRSATLIATALMLSGCSSNTFVLRTPDPAPRTVSHSAKSLGIPPGQLPPPGMCRIWYPGRPPGHQPRSASCASLERRVPAGAWLISRERGAPGRVRVTVYDDKRPGKLISVRIYSATDGRLIDED